MDIAKCRLDNSIGSTIFPILGKMTRTLRSASALVASWQCQRCSSNNDSTKNKQRCFSCWSYREGIAPLSAAGIVIANAHRSRGTSFLSSNKNDAPNNASPCKVGNPRKRGAKRKSPSRGLGSMVLHPLPLSLPPALRPMRSITHLHCHQSVESYMMISLGQR